MLVERLRDWLAHPRPPAGLDLPTVQAPALDGLRAEVPAPEALTADALVEEYDRYLLSVAPRIERAPGEPARPGDVVEVALAAFQPDGEHLTPIPFTARDGVERIAGAEGPLRNLDEALIGAVLGDRIDVPVTFPDDWPVAGLRGLHVRMLARVQRITELQMPDPDDEDLLARLGVVLDMEELMQALRERWTEARSEALADEGRKRVLEALRARAPLQVPTELMERAIWERWAHEEGRILLDLDADEDDLELSLGAWAESKELAADVVRGAHVALVLRAIAERDGLTLERDDIDAALEDAADELDEEVDDLRAALRDDPTRAVAVANQAFHDKVVRHVMDQAEIIFLTP